MNSWHQMRHDPIRRFQTILGRAEQAGIVDPNAMTLATVDGEGRPSTRTVLLKGCDAQGFVFYTNLHSRKGRQLQGNSQVSLTFFWRQLGRQVHVAGEAVAVSSEEADDYFATRPRGSQIGAWASRQSEELSGRPQLLAAVTRYEARYLGQQVPRPPHWSGFRVLPRRIEFWRAGLFRLHRREVFERSSPDQPWQRRKLFP